MNRRHSKPSRITWMLSQKLDEGKSIEVDEHGNIIRERTLFLYDGAVVLEKVKRGYRLAEGVR